MKMQSLGCLAAIAAAACHSAASGQPVWEEDFESYFLGILVGQEICDPDCWQAWDFDTRWGLSEVVDEEALSGTKSVGVIGGTVGGGGSGGLGWDDLVRTFVSNDLTSGVYAMTLHVFIPAEATTGTPSINILNTYPATANPDWSASISFDVGAGEVQSWLAEGVLDLVKGQWTEVRLVINLDDDTQEIFYEDELLISKSWSGGVAEGGAARIQAIDFFGNDATFTTYFDDLSIVELEPFGACCLEDGSCIPDLERAPCEAMSGGVFQGIGSSCAASECPTRIPCGPSPTVGCGWQVDVEDQPGGPGVDWSASDAGINTNTCETDRNDCDFSSGADDVYNVTIPWAQDWTFQTCGSSFDTDLLIGTMGPCSTDIHLDEFADACEGTDNGVDGTFFLEAGEYNVAIEPFTLTDCGDYNLVITARCPDIERDPGAVDNDGPACFNGDTDPVNVGCNADPEIGQSPAFSAMECDTLYQGTFGNFLTDAGTGRRDLDWYKLELDAETDLTVSMIGQGPNIVVFLADLNATPGEGEDECTDAGTIIVSSSTNGCTLTASYSLTVEAGLYSVIAAHDFADPADIPCGDLSYYELDVDCGGCNGDTNGDGVVDTADLVFLLSQWGPMGGGGPADFNGDGTVDTADLIKLLGAWGPCV